MAVPAALLVAARGVNLLKLQRPDETLQEKYPGSAATARAAEHLKAASPAPK